jgi:hypothetical protein
MVRLPVFVLSKDHDSSLRVVLSNKALRLMVLRLC